MKFIPPIKKFLKHFRAISVYLHMAFLYIERTDITNRGTPDNKYKVLALHGTRHLQKLKVDTCRLLHPLVFELYV